MTEDKSDFCETRNKAVVSKDEDVSCWNCLKSEGNNKEPLPLSKVRKQHREKLRLYSFLASQVTKPKAVPLKQRVSENYSVAKKVDEQILQQKSTENYYADNIERHLSNISEKLKASPELGPKTSKVSQSKLLHIENDLYSLADELEESASKLSRVSERAKDVVIKETYTENTNREYKKVSLKPGLSPILTKSPDLVEVQSKVLVESSSPKIKRSIFKDTADVHRYSSVIEFKKRDDIVEELNDDIDIPAISSGRTSSASDKIENASSCGSDSGFADSNTNRELSSPELSVKSERLYKSCLRKDVKALPSLTGDNTIPATSTTS
ncbi:uncharacterized protein LOC125242526 [Leguminivora glycinivorella]|uniref:uncharacterized protein LOC125242526 n=1 Tax=Leguminivora glycinivorella TaxID=1035111 RepID=UPI002010180D|nr:uncharacterized protein LOC125242526 [Leguminivora glycinivorella]